MVVLEANKPECATLEEDQHPLYLPLHLGTAGPEGELPRSRRPNASGMPMNEENTKQGRTGYVFPPDTLYSYTCQLSAPIASDFSPRYKGTEEVYLK